MKEALNFIQEKRNTGANYKKYLVEYNWRFAFPFSVLITILIGSICGIYFRKAVLVLAFFLSIIISFGYYGIMAVGMAYGKSGKLDPVVAAWLGNVVYLAIGIIAIRLKKLRLVKHYGVTDYETVLKIISGQQLKFLTGLARMGGHTPTSSQFLKQSGINQASSAQAALKRLLDLKIIFYYENEYRFVNPFFRTWLLYKNL